MATNNKAKINFQAELLIKLHSSDFGIKALVKNVKSGDPENIEARVARIYCKIFSAIANFAENVLQKIKNIFLNYGYIVLRAMTARAICATGYILQLEFITITGIIHSA